MRAVFVVGVTPTGVEHELPENARKLSKNYLRGSLNSLMGLIYFGIVAV